LRRADRLLRLLLLVVVLVLVLLVVGAGAGTVGVMKDGALPSHSTPTLHSLVSCVLSHARPPWTPLLGGSGNCNTMRILDEVPPPPPHGSVHESQSPHTDSSQSATAVLSDTAVHSTSVLQSFESIKCGQGSPPLSGSSA